MPFAEALRVALQAIFTAKLRSFFTLLGIIVSVGFLVAVVAIIQGMNAYVRENITDAVIGTNSFHVRRSPITVGLLSDEEFADLVHFVPVGAATYSRWLGAQIARSFPDLRFD